MALFRLAYISTSLLGGEGQLQLADILLMSRRNNEAVHVTGALLATQSNFAQVLEGERADVETTYARIATDARHKDLDLLLAGPLTAREFPQWSMAFIGPSNSADEAVQRVAGNLSATERGDRARHFVNFMRDLLIAHTYVRRHVPRAQGHIEDITAKYGQSSNATLALFPKESPLP